MQRIAIAIALCLIVLSSAQASEYVRVEFGSLGTIELELLDYAAPNTVANFLAYVDDGSYVDSLIHSSVSNFVIQGGGYVNQDSQSVFQLPNYGTVANEFGRSNVRGTVAMAKGGDPDSATREWFVSTTDNSFLDDPVTSGAFTVFAEVIKGMDVVDAINAAPTWPKTPADSGLRIADVSDPSGPALGELRDVPLRDVDGVTPVTIDNYVLMTNVERFTPLVGDANMDEVVDGTDLGLWSAGFGASPASLNMGDFTGEGFVDGDDVDAWDAHFGETGRP